MYLSESSTTVTSILNECVCVCVCVCCACATYRMRSRLASIGQTLTQCTSLLPCDWSTRCRRRGGRRGAEQTSCCWMRRDTYTRTSHSEHSRENSRCVCVCVCFIITVVCEINLESVTKVCLSYSSVSFVCRLQ